MDNQLITIINRIEKLNEEKAAISEDIKQVYLEAKGNGFDVKALRAVIMFRAIADQEQKEQEALLECYKAQIGMN